MKKLILIFMLFWLGFQCSAFASGDDKGIKFYKGSWDELMREAKKQNKPFFIDFWATWCGPCKMLNATTFRDERVGEFANAHFLAYKMDVDQPENKMISAKYQIQVLPTIVFFNAKGEEMGRFSGYRPPEAFLQELMKYADGAPSRKGKKDDKKAGAAGQFKFDDYVKLKTDYSRKVTEPQAFKSDSLIALMAEARQLGGRKEDLLLDGVIKRAQTNGLTEQLWLLDAAYALGARDYAGFVKLVHPRFEGRQLESPLLHWCAVQFITADLDDIPAEPMQWINALIRQSSRAEYFDTKAALLLRDKKYDAALEASREAQKHAAMQNYPEESVKILEALAQKGS
jgi:thioredoxin-related protein